MDHANPRYILENEKIYLGVLATSSLLEIKDEADRQELNTFFNSSINFYIELVTDIKKRFTFKEPVFQVVNVVNPVVAQLFEIKSLVHVVSMFPILKQHINLQDLDNEWREHALLEDIDKNKSAEDYWAQIFSLKNAAGIPRFKNLEIVINFLLILPFSNASVERIFSTLNNIKSENRNKLGRDSLVAILHTKGGVKSEGGIIAFEPNNQMLKGNIWKNKK